MKRAKNFRKLERCCAICRFGYFSGGGNFSCIRSDGWNCDVGDYTQFLRTCDYFKNGLEYGFVKKQLF